MNEENEPSITQFLELAVDWIGSNIDRFATSRHHWSNAAALSALNPVLDLAIVCRAVRAHSVPAVATAVIDTCLDRIASVVENLSFQEALLGSPRTLRYYIWLMALARNASRAPDATGYRAVRGMLEAGYSEPIFGVSQSAQDALEAGYILTICEIQAPRSSAYGMESLARKILAGAEESANVSDEVAYAVTHAILFLSDMATRPVSGLSIEWRERAAGIAGTLLSGCLRRRHWDLTAELLLCRLALGAPPDPVDARGHSGLLGAQLDEGAVPGPLFSVAERQALPAWQRGQYTFRCCYHTTLAAVLYATTRASGGVRLPALVARNSQRQVLILLGDHQACRAAVIEETGHGPQADLESPVEQSLVNALVAARRVTAGLVSVCPPAGQRGAAGLAVTAIDHGKALGQPLVEEVRRIA